MLILNANMANKNQFVEGELINAMQTWDKNKKSPIGIEPMASRTTGGRCIHCATRTHKEHGYQLFDSVTTETSSNRLQTQLIMKSHDLVAPVFNTKNHSALQRVMLTIKHFSSGISGVGLRGVRIEL